MKKYAIRILLVGLFVVSACGTEPAEPTATPEPTPEPTEAEVRTLRMMTHDSFDISEEVIDAFEEQHNARVEILKAGDAGVMVNQAILSTDSPLADVIYGVDNTLLSRALDAEILVPYASPLLEEIPDRLELDPEHRALPVDYGDVCLNYDKGWFAERPVDPPAHLEDLTEEAYRGLTVVEHPATSSPGLAFMLATIDHFGTEGEYTWQDYWADMRANDVLVVQGWSEAYYNQFTYYGEGQRPIVVSYASSPPVEVHFAEEDFEEAPTAAVTGDGSCFRQIEFVGILEGTEQQALAEAWIDFVLGPTFQEDIPLHMFVFPANENVTLPEVFVEFAAVPEDPAEIGYEAIDANRELWVETWTEVVLR
jgi:thiamine transport system substrate-binding protein